VPTFNECILSHDHHFHWHNQTTDEPYCLQDFLEWRGSEPESPSPPAAHKRECSCTGWWQW
jgi:hypothetical protein